MKKANHQNGKPGHNVKVAASIHKPALLRAIIRELASKKPRKRHDARFSETGWRVFQSASTETYITGTVVLSSQEERVPMTYNTNYLFTCIQTDKSPMNIEWGISLN